MKTKYTLAIMMLSSVVAFGQEETDDMYFNSKDRAKLNAVREVVLAKQYKEADEKAKVLSPINPTDSYSGRSVNPEYTNRLKTDPNQANIEPQYFSSNYQPTGVNKKLGNPNYGSGDFYSPYNGSSCTCGSSFYNPYSYNTGYSPLMSPYSSFYPSYGYSPYGFSPYGYSPYGSGMSTMMGYSFSAYNSGFFGGMSYGMGSPFWNNYYGLNSYRNGYSNVAVVDAGSGGRNVVYGKRSSRSSELDNAILSTRENRTVVDSQGRTRGAGGRIANDGASSYYQRGWRNNPSINSSIDRGVNSGRTSFWNTVDNSGNSWGGRTNSSFSNGSNSRSSMGGSSGFSGGGGRSGGNHSSGGTRGRD